MASPGTTSRSPMAAANGARATARAGRRRSSRASSGSTRTNASTSSKTTQVERLERMHMKIFLIALAMLVACPALAQGTAPAQAPASQDDAPPPASGPQAERERQATQPGNNAPVWRDVQSGKPQFTSIPGRETEVLIQPQARFPGQEHRSTAGEAWRQFRNGPVTFYGGWLVVLIAVAILAFYFAKGPVKLHDKPSGRLIRRFSSVEQIVHWSTAISFCVLGLSGLIMLFGKYILLPVIGYTLFAWLTALGKNLHNFVAPLFIVSVIAMIFMWLRDNLPKSYDWMWFGKGWAFFTRGEHIPSGRFNAGEKAWFWGGVIVLSVIVSGSGIVLLFPNFD